MYATTTGEREKNSAMDSGKRPAKSPRLQAEQRQKRAVHASVKEIIRQHQHNPARDERRRQGRVEYVQTLKIRLESGRELSVLSRDLSCEGVRLVGTAGLLGQKIHLTLPRGEAKPPLQLSVRILWTCTVGDGLFENGGTFLEMITEDADV